MKTEKPTKTLMIKQNSKAFAKKLIGYYIELNSQKQCQWYKIVSIAF